MKNYQRYKNTAPGGLVKKDLLYYLCRVPADKKILPLLNQLKGQKIMEVGLGSGYYTQHLLKENEVVGVDRNPQLCPSGIKVYQGDATELSNLSEDNKFDMVLSFWMTEYLDPQQLMLFFDQAKKVLQTGGKLISTIISPHGWGAFYVLMARKVKGINKYCHCENQTLKKLRQAGFENIEIIQLRSWLALPWAYLVIAQ